MNHYSSRAFRRIATRRQANHINGISCVKKELDSVIHLRRIAGTLFMDVLNKLFEQHFHAPPQRISAAPGELGGSGRKIIRLANENVTAIGILYDVRDEISAVAQIFGIDFGTGRPWRRKCLENSRKATFSSRTSYRSRCGDVSLARRYDLAPENRRVRPGAAECAGAVRENAARRVY